MSYVPWPGVGLGATQALRQLLLLCFVAIASGREYRQCHAALTIWFGDPKACDNTAWWNEHLFTVIGAVLAIIVIVIMYNHFIIPRSRHLQEHDMMSRRRRLQEQRFFRQWIQWAKMSFGKQKLQVVGQRKLALDVLENRPMAISCLSVNEDGSMICYSPNNHEVHIAEYTGSTFKTIAVLTEHQAHCARPPRAARYVQDTTKYERLSVPIARRVCWAHCKAPEMFIHLVI